MTGEGGPTAASDLQSAGFNAVQLQWPVSDQANDGVVVAQTPVGKAPRGATIVLYVGSATG